MSKWFVGQMVRVVSTHPDAEEVSGLEAIVNKVDCMNTEDIHGHVAVVVAGDGDWCFYPWELEPILYDGEQPSEFSFSELMDNLRTKVQEEV